MRFFIMASLARWRRASLPFAEPFCAGLASAKRFPILLRCEAGRAFEKCGEVSLPAKTAGQRNHRQRFVRHGQTPPGVLEAQAPDVIADGAPVTAAKLAGEAHRVPIDRGGDFVERQRLGEPRANQLLGLI